MSLKDWDLPITILNNTKITLNGVSVLGVLTNVDNNNNVVLPDFKRPEFDFRTLYADEFWYCYQQLNRQV